MMFGERWQLRCPARRTRRSRRGVRAPNARPQLAAGIQPFRAMEVGFYVQDLPPVKGHNVQMEGVLPPGAVPLIPVSNKP